MKIYTYLMLILFALYFMGCGENTPEQDKSEIIDALSTNIKAMQDEDIKGMKNTIHSESLNLEVSVAYAEKLFERYDLNYELVKYNVDKIEGDHAYVSFTQITRKISGPEFRDNRITGVHTFKKDSGTWKIYSTKVNNIEFL